MGRKYCGKRRKYWLPAISPFPTIFSQGVILLRVLNSLPNDDIFDLTKFKAFADNKQNIAKIIVSVFDRTENIVGKGENAGNQHFLLFPQCFQMTS